jgi:hypothetical protein
MRLAPLVFATLAISCQRGRATDEDRGTSVSRPIEGTQETTPPPEPEPSPDLETPPDPGVGGIYGPADSPAPAPAPAATDDYEAQLYDRAIEDDPQQDTATGPEPDAPNPPDRDDDPWTATSNDPWAGTRAPREPAPSTTDPMPPAKRIPRAPQPSPPPR